EYFSLNTDQLSVAFLQGQVDLENVPLRTSSLRKFDIPLQVKHGLIGKLQLQVPLTRIRSQPWILRIRDFLVLVGPYSSNYDVEIVEQFKQQNLEKMLDELEIEQKTHPNLRRVLKLFARCGRCYGLPEARKKLLSQLGIKLNENEEQNSWWGTTSLLSTISSNIQILVENVHIKYEATDFNFGVQIDSLNVQTTNAQWRVGFVDPTDGINIFKKFDVKGFSIYWNPENTLNDSPIVLPLSLDSLKFNIRSQRIELELTQKQIAQIQQFMDDWSMFERARPHRKWRPNTSIISSPKRWWQFAINRQLEQIRNKNICRESKALFARLHLVNTYCKAYRHRLNCFLTSQLKGSQSVSSPSFDANKLTINAPKYSHEETTLIKQIEHGADFSYTDLHILREAVFQKMLSELKLQFPSNTNENSRTSSPFQIIESEQEIKEENNNILKINQHQTQQNGGGGWLNWMTNWFGSEEKNNEFLEKENDLILNDSVYLNNLSTPKLTSPRRDHALNPELEEIEKRMETEILQMLNDTLDDYNILRRDNLLAELVINFARVHLRIATDKASKQENNEKQKINLLMLTFDLDQLNGRIQLSPKEHRTEMSINIGDLSIQQMQQQQQYINNFEEKKKDSNDLSKNNNDESLFCGFQEDILSNSDITTNLLFTIGRRNENTTKNKNFSFPIVELFYKRLAPKMEIYHELNICCAPLAMLADDCFIATLREIVGRVEENNKENYM
uniref:Vacuolar protein sorting-associated protein 13 second N-terminal domain-containing protein n=1 Tax=Meloidogyne javanica TaxID=6303 RepID=A0A915M5F0_MELJA